MANFYAFWIVAFLSGGDALNGKEEGGRYFIEGHGHYTEVTRSFFLYSRIQTMSAMILMALSVVVVLWVNWRKNLR